MTLLARPWIASIAGPRTAPVLLALGCLLAGAISASAQGFGEIRTTDYGTEPTFGGSYFWRGFAFKVDQPTTVTHLIGGGRENYIAGRKEFRGALLNATVDPSGRALAGTVLREIRFTSNTVNQVVDIPDLALATNQWYFIAQGSVQGTVLHWYVQNLNAGDLVAASGRLTDWYPSAEDRCVRWLGGNHGAGELLGREFDFDPNKPALGFRYLSSALLPVVETLRDPLQGRLHDSKGSPTALYIQYGTVSNLLTGSKLNLAQTGAMAPPALDFFTTASDLLPNTRYYYRARAINDAGRSDGAIFSFITPAAPAAPTITSVTPGNTLLNVFVTTPGTINNYQYSIDNGATWITRSPASTNSPLVITGLVNGVTYTIRVRAIAQGVVGPPSASANGRPTGDQTISFPPIEDQRITNVVTLAASATSGLPVTFAVASGPATLSGGNQLSFTGTGVVNVVASQAGNASWSPAPSVTNTFKVDPVNMIPLLERATFRYGWYARLSFYLMRCSFFFETELQPSGGPLQVKGLWLETPLGDTIEIYHSTNQTVYGSNVFQQFISASGYGDDIPGDGDYTLFLEYADNTTTQTTFSFTIPGTTNPLPTPEQFPVIFSPEQGASLWSPIPFAWSEVTDSNVSQVSLQTTNVFVMLPDSETEIGPYDMPAGSHEVEVWFLHTYQGLSNDDGVPYEIGKGNSKVHTFTVLNDEEYTVIYFAGIGGTVTGTTPQTVPHGTDTDPVTAVPENGALFDRWSDGVTDNPRTDLNVTNDFTVTALFKSPAGVPLDWYERFGIFPGPGETWGDVDAGDLDMDGESNADEFGADTNPADGSDALRITNAVRLPEMTVQFRSSTNRLYQLKTTDDPILGIWYDVFGALPRPGVGGPDSLTDPFAPGVDQYYRVESIVP